MSAVAVDCVFDANGTVRVNRVQTEDKWRPVSQGRQWLDQDGRHVLIMFSGEHVSEIILRPSSMKWEIKRGRGDVQLV